jgi:hypothetical protein
LGLGLVPWPAVAFFFSIGVFEEICPDAEALDAAIVAV